MDDGITPMDTGSVKRIPSEVPGFDERLDSLEIICESSLIVTGTFQPGVLPPDDHLGCWPVGTWTINATVDTLGCDPQPELPEDFIYEVSHDDEAGTINVGFVNDPTDERVNLKISTEGDGLCHGGMAHYAMDGTVWAFQPTLQEDGTLSGRGTYSVYSFDSF